MNKKCLKCNKDFEAKRDSAKFCSTSCRVMYNRNKPKVPKGLSTESKLEVLYNAVLETLASLQHKSFPPQYSGETQFSSTKEIAPIDIPMFPPKPKIRRSFENYQQLKLDCESREAWEVLKTEILASDLSSKQKSLLTS